MASISVQGVTTLWLSLDDPTAATQASILKAVHGGHFKIGHTKEPPCACMHVMGPAGCKCSSKHFNLTGTAAAQAATCDISGVN